MVKNIEERDRRFAENLAKLIDSRNLKQKKLASDAKIDAVTLNRILNFKQSAGKSAAAALSRALSIPLDELYGEFQTTESSLKLDVIKKIVTMSESDIRALWMQLCADVGDDEP